MKVLKTEKELLFSLTANNFRWSYTKGTGAGGQKRNKTSSAVHCFHDPSGAHGYSEGSRSQHENKSEAFQKCVNTPEFKKWHHLEIARRTGELTNIEQEVEKELKKIKVEVKHEGKWIEVSKNDPLDLNNEEQGIES